MATRIAMTVDHDDICDDDENRYGEEKVTIRRSAMMIMDPAEDIENKRQLSRTVDVANKLKAKSCRQIRI